MGETPEDAALRELREETGIEGEVCRLIGVYSQKSPEYGSVLVVGYFIRRIGGRLKAGSDVVDAVFSRPVLRNIAFESQRRMIREEGF